MPQTIKLPLKKILTDVCDLYKNSPTADETGHSVGVATFQFGANLPCRLLPISTRSREFKADIKVSISRFTLFIMPYTSGSDTIDEHTFVKVNGNMYNVIEVLNPVLNGAPCELLMERVKP